MGRAHPSVWAEQSTAADTGERPLRVHSPVRLSASVRLRRYNEEE
jgi:hypothetical protein